MGMKRRTLNSNHFVISQLLQDSDTLPHDHNYTDSPPSKYTKIASSKRSRRVIEKRVVTVPINDVGSLRMKGDQISSAPPSDSWAWRKYGQKPIKGSPYPRGYYRCSSSKGCPARKQVERSRLDPNMLLVTYSCEHNHPWPAAASRNNLHNHDHRAAVVAAAPTNTTTSVSEEEDEVEEEEEEEEEKKPMTSLISSHQSHHELISEDKFSNIEEAAPPLINNIAGEFGWFTDFESTSCTMLESPISAEERITTDNEMAMIFTTREEDESLFADLGELPECSRVFRRGIGGATAA
ncbi:putative WRKY transcription factor 65 [Sesamum alatum]|uniref:WRKY transcription factor 65 n=1 Tax=Sesamum alatum TaxID=300844 RepID=A0AAE1Y0S8_9LAMI|nr:putative WRKY transcription factor 65 [Sesamum alatum]